MTPGAPVGSASGRLRAGGFVGLAFAGLAMAVLAAGVVRSPGYMDADYYFATGRELSRGHGFSEPFLWNYLDDPSGLPHPSHLYWMPLASVLAAGSMGVLGEGFRAAQIPFLLMTTALPPLTAALALRVTSEVRWAVLSGLLAAFSGFFLPFFVTTDAFAAYALLGGGLLWALAEASQSGKARWWLGSGALLGLCHLARADAPLMLLPAVYAVVRSRQGRTLALGSLLGGYAAVMAPWFARNLLVVGSPLNPGGVRVLWMLGYDDLFSYPASGLSFGRWLEAGLAAHLELRLSAAGTMLQRALAENGLVFLGPFMLLGAVRLWSQVHVRIAILYLIELFVGLTLAFPAVGARGAYFHASVAAMPILWSLAPVGVAAGTQWVGARRGWKIPQAVKTFTAGAVVVAGLLTLVLLARRMPGPGGGGWGSGSEAYEAVGEQLARLDADRAPVAVNNPPGFFAATEWPAVVIPDGDPSVLHQVVQRYGVGWVVLDANHPQGLAELYAVPTGLEWLRPVTSWPDPSGQPVWLLAVVREAGP